MAVLILSKQDRNEYETEKLSESFNSKGMESKVCHPDDFDIEELYMDLLRDKEELLKTGVT